MKYRMYIDEAGDTVLRHSQEPSKRYLSLTGVIIDYDYVRNIINPQMEALKAKYFPEHHPDEPVLFHRRPMIDKEPPFDIFANEAIREQFNEELLHSLRTWDYRVLSACIDKHNHREEYRANEHILYHYCLKVLVERYSLFLKRVGQVGDVMVESRGKDDISLKEEYARIYDGENTYIRLDILRNTLSSKQLLVKPKASNVAGLQLADLLAHDSRTEILYENGLLDREPAFFAKEIISILQGKYDQQPGRVYGKKFLP